MNEQEEGGHAHIYSSKMRISPRALENHNILFHAFANSTEYMRYIQISNLIIKAATQAPQIPTHFFDTVEEFIHEGNGFTTTGSTGSLHKMQEDKLNMEIHQLAAPNWTQAQLDTFHNPTNVSPQLGQSLNTVLT